MTKVRPHQVAQVLRDITPRLHARALDLKGRNQPLFVATHGMCDYLTALARQELQNHGIDMICFVGIDIPTREIDGLQTHASHTVGIVHEFPDDNGTAVWFDFACAQYGTGCAAMVEVIEKEDLYQRLREVYGGGIWEPGGSYLSQLDVDVFASSVVDEG